MEIINIEKTRKRLFAFLCIAFSLPVVLAFTIVDSIEGDTIEVVINILMGLILVAAFVGIKKWGADLLVYRLGLAFLSAIFLYNIAIGSGHGTAVYWLFSFPLVFVFFLGQREGSMIAAAFLGLLYVVLINPFSLKIYQYDVGVSLRFLVSLLFVTLMAYGLEASREKYGHLLMEKQTKLEAEKQQLERALGEIKTLSGLIPICSSCKKVRDDEGYWQQVETYVRARSSAEFSHGICPDCLEVLYSDYKSAKGM